MASRRKKFAFGCATLLVLLGCGVAWLHHLVFDRTPGQFLDVDGVSIYYTDEGKRDGEAVVLIHGLAAHADINWRRPGINAALAEDFRVVALDLRGHGLSGRPHDPDAYGIKVVEDIARVMDHLKIERAHLAGYSLGGFLGLKFAALHPERVRSMAICASGWKDPESKEPIRSPYRDDPETRLPDDEKQYNRMMRRAQAGMGNYVEAAALPDPIDWARDYFGDRVVDREAMRALKRSLGDFVVTREQLAAMPTPIVCFMGTRDGLKPYAMDLKAVKPEVDLVLIDGADHVTTVLFGQFRNGLRDFFLKHQGQ